MSSKSQVYCLSCGSIVPANEAGTIFRTGFYKVTAKLGFCTACPDSSAPEAVPAAMGSEFYAQPESGGEAHMT